MTEAMHNSHLFQKRKQREFIFRTCYFSYYAFQGFCMVHFAFNWFLEHQILFDMTNEWTWRQDRPLIDQFIFTFDEGERILIMSFLRNYSRGFSEPVPRGTNGYDVMCKCFLGRLELKTPIFFCTIGTMKKQLLPEIEGTLLIFDFY